MDTRELAKRTDQEIAQVHARIDDHHSEFMVARRSTQARYHEDNDRILEEIHDLKNLIEGLKFRLKSLEEHPPVIPTIA